MTHPRNLRDEPLIAEVIDVLERLITAPRAGTFHPAVPDLAEGGRPTIDVGQPIGVLVNSSGEEVVTSPFAGILMGLLVLPGERVRPAQPLAWLSP